MFPQLRAGATKQSVSGASAAALEQRHPVGVTRGDAHRGAHNIGICHRWMPNTATPTKGSASVRDFLRSRSSSVGLRAIDSDCPEVSLMVACGIRSRSWKRSAKRFARTRSLCFLSGAGREVVGESIAISPGLRKRFRAWNQTWQVVLDPVSEINWPDPDVGREWIAEGNALVQDLQHEIGTKYRVVGDFAAYNPDA